METVEVELVLVLDYESYVQQVLVMDSSYLRIL